MNAPKPSRGPLFRTTLKEISQGCWLPQIGVYLVAYNGAVIYVGMTNDDMVQRFAKHLYNTRRGDTVGAWMYSADCWSDVRVDILVPPTEEPDKASWLRGVELACIREFRPIVNSANNT